jgi:hypothetical protein
MTAARSLSVVQSKLMNWAYMRARIHKLRNYTYSRGFRNFSHVRARVREGTVRLAPRRGDSAADTRPAVPIKVMKLIYNHRPARENALQIAIFALTAFFVSALCPLQRHARPEFALEAR